MKIKIPSKTVEACDICKRECAGCLLTQCLVCKRDYCHVCEAIICGCIHQPKLCKECAKSERVRATVERFAKPLIAVLNRRATALRRIKPPIPS